MRELDQLIYTRLSTSDDLLNAINDAGGKPHKPGGPPYGNAWGYNRIHHSFQKTKQEVPQLNFFEVQMTPGTLTGNHGRTLQATYEFAVTANNYVDQLRLIRLLFDGWTFDIPTNFKDVGKVSSVFDWEGNEGFDAELNESFKVIRIRFFVVPKPQIPT